MVKRRRFKKYRKKSDLNFNIIFCILIFLLFILFSIIFFNFKARDKLNISLENISGFKISAENIFILKELAEKYDIDFPEILTYYSLENNFFSEKITRDLTIEQDFIFNYENIKAKYKHKDFLNYYNILNTVINEIKYFPIPEKDGNEYIYADSWGAERTYGGKRIHMGTDIIDRENIEGRIPILSMTDGKIENLGWNEKGGYRVGIRTKNGSYYYYAHLDSFAESIAKGNDVSAGTLIGYMGNTGYSTTEGTKGNFEVHLHLGIEIKANLKKEMIWINPYPFLRIIEEENLKNYKKTE